MTHSLIWCMRIGDSICVKRHQSSLSTDTLFLYHSAPFIFIQLVQLAVRYDNHTTNFSADFSMKSLSSFQNHLGQTSEEVMAERYHETKSIIRALFLRDLKFDNQEPGSSIIVTGPGTQIVLECKDRGNDGGADDGWDREAIDIDSSDENGQSAILHGAVATSPSTPVTMSSTASTSSSTPLVSLSSRQLSLEDSHMSASSTPTDEELQHYIESVKLMYQSLAVMFIIMESWAAAYRRIHVSSETRGRTFPLGKPSPPPPSPSLIQCILGNVGFPTPLLSPSLLEHSFGLAFPDLTTPPSPMPQSFSLTPLDWKYPSMPYIEPTLNAATVEEGALPDWMRQSQRRSTSQSIDMSWLATPMPGTTTGESKRRAKRAIKPLPKRAQMAYGTGNMTSVDAGRVVMALTQVAVGVGSVIVTGVKRLRSELEEGGLRRWKKRREY